MDNQTQQNQASQQGTQNQTVVNQQTQNNSTNTQQNVELDIHNLPPEFQRYLDQERTRASQTARANARKELAQDQEFIAQVRSGFEQEVNHTVEEQIQVLNKRISSGDVRNVLMQGGITDAEDLQYYTDLFASEDIDGSVEKAKSFVSRYNKSLQDRMDKKQQQSVRNMDTPATNPSTVNEKDSLQAQLDEARKDTSYMRAVRISSIMRQASEKGITLK
jgi:hypothetical protein|nr:MAG TPA: hypothetical protein [Caudoviricetes sp.]